MSILSLTSAIWLKIIRNLDTSDIMSLRSTCKKLNQLLDHPSRSSGEHKDIMVPAEARKCQTNFRFEKMYDTQIPRDTHEMLEKSAGFIRKLDWHYCHLNFLILQEIAELSRKTLESLEFFNVRYRYYGKDEYVTFENLSKTLWKDSDPSLLLHLNVQLDTLIIQGNCLNTSGILLRFILTQVFLSTFVVQGPIIKIFRNSLISSWNVDLATLSLTFELDGTVKMEQASRIILENMKNFLMTQNNLKNLELVNFRIDKELREILLYGLKSLENLKLGNMSCTEMLQENKDLKEKNLSIKSLTLMGLWIDDGRFCSDFLELVPNLSILTLKDTNFNIQLCLALRKMKLRKLRIERTFAKSRHGYFQPFLKELEFRDKSAVSKNDNFNIIKCNLQIETLVVPESYQFDTNFRKILKDHQNLEGFVLTGKSTFDFLEDLDI